MTQMQQPTLALGAQAAWRREATVALGFLSLVSLLNYFDRVLITVVAEPVKREFGLSDTQLSLLTGPAFILIYSLSSLAAGWLADRFNRRTVISTALALWSLTTLLTGLVRSFPQMVIFRAGVGVGEGGFNPAALSLLSDFNAPARRSSAIGIFYATGMIGILLSFLVGGYVSVEYGWRAAFLVGGAPGLVLAIVMFLFMREPERGRFDAAPARASTQEHDQKHDQERGASLTVLKRNAAYRWLVISAAIGTFASLGILQWLSIFFIRSHAMDLQQVGVLFGPAMACGMMVGLFGGGWIGNWLARKSLSLPVVFCAWVNVAVVPLYWTVLWAPSVEMALGVTFIAAALGTSWGPAFTAAMQNVCGARVRAMAAAVSNLGTGLIAQALLPLIVGVLSDMLAPRYGKDSLRYALTVVVCVNLLAAACFVRSVYFVRRRFAGETT